MTRALSETGAPEAEGEADGGARRGSKGFRPRDRLLDSRDFDRVLRQGRRRSSSELVVVTAPGRQEEPDRTRRGCGDGTRRSRLGITAGRKAGGSVKRNRFKRRVREWFRNRREELALAGLDIVVIVRRPGIDLSLAELDLRLCGILGLKRTQAIEKIQDI